MMMCRSETAHDKDILERDGFLIAPSVLTGSEVGELIAAVSQIADADAVPVAVGAAGTARVVHARSRTSIAVLQIQRCLAG